MTTAPEKKPKQMPKGGRKGGTSFPRISLADALVYSKKLVSKTHTGPQPQDVIFAGVVGAKSGTGRVRIAALKQYGLISGDAKTKYSAADLAKQIGGAPPDEVQVLQRKAVLRPAVFKKVFDAFHGDTVTKAKLRQRVIDLKVHPDEAETCVALYLSGMTTAGLVVIDGDKVAHLASGDIATVTLDFAKTDGQERERTDEEPDDFDSGVDDSDTSGETPNAAAKSNGVEGDPSPLMQKGKAQPGPRAVFNVNVSLDSSLDIEKLQKQLELLKRFGAI